MTGQHQPLDTRTEIITPENIAFEYRVAGPFRRLPAYLIDVATRVTLLLLLLVMLSWVFGYFGLEGLGIGLWMILWFVTDWFFGGLFEALWNGQTPGKRLMGLRVLSTTGQPINGFQAILRNFLRAADAMPLLTPLPIPTYLLGLLSATCSTRFQRLGDLASGTMVVIEEPVRSFAVARVENPQVLALAADLPASLRIHRGTARALSSYIQRREGFGALRRAEIAVHLGEELRKRCGLPLGTNHDLLLCAVYYRSFIADHVADEADPFAVLEAEAVAPAAP
jgi:uncharacterized RDD family membrane protein YckC